MKSHVSKQDKNNPNILKLIKKTELVRLRGNIKDNRRKLFQTETRLAQNKNELIDMISDDKLVKDLITWCKQSEDKEYAKVKERHLRKFETFG